MGKDTGELSEKVKIWRRHGADTDPSLLPPFLSTRDFSEEMEEPGVMEVTGQETKPAGNQTPCTWLPMEQLFLLKPEHMESCAQAQAYHTFNIAFYGSGQGTENLQRSPFDLGINQQIVF